MSTDSPFAPRCTRQSFLETLGLGEALRRLGDGLGGREPFLLVTGEPGIGKTALANEAIARWGSRASVAYLSQPVRTGDELLEEILRRFGGEVPDGAGRSKRTACFEAALAEVAERGQVAVVVVDDAHHLSGELLEELRLLVNAAQQAGRPMEVLLVGLPALEGLLDDPALAALRLRVSVRAKLAPLTPGETRRYIRHRLSAAGDDRPNLFPRGTCAEIASLSGGVPRRVNVLAAEALRRAGEAGRPSVEPGHVREAAVALTGELPRSGPADDRDDEPAAASVPAPGQVGGAGTVGAAAAAPEVREAATPRKGPDAPAETRPRKAAAPIAGADPPRAAPAAPPGDAPVDSEYVPPTRSDPDEWVARILGDRGPIRISSQVTATPAWSADDVDPEQPDGTGEGEPRRARSAGPEAPAPAARRGGADLRVVTVGSLVAVAVLAAGWWGYRATRNAPDSSARPAAAVNPADSASPPAPVTTTRTPGAPRRAAPAEAADRAPKAEPSAPLPRGPYTLDVGARLDLWSALDERARIQRLTGIEGWVVPAGEPDAGEYGIVLGIYKSHARAQGAARMLMRSRTLPRVTVVSLPPRSRRQ